MKQLIIAGVLSLVLSFAVATFVHAQTTTPTPTVTGTNNTTTMPSGAPNTGY